MKTTLSPILMVLVVHRDCRDLRGSRVVNREREGRGGGEVGVRKVRRK